LRRPEWPRRARRRPQLAEAEAAAAAAAAAALPAQLAAAAAARAAAARAAAARTAAARVAEARAASWLQPVHVALRMAAGEPAAAAAEAVPSQYGPGAAVALAAVPAAVA